MMRSKFLSPVLAMFLLSAVFLSFKGDKNEPWTPKQLLAPSALAEQIRHNGSKQPIIFNIGPAGSIKNAINIGAAHETENLAILKQKLDSLPRNADVVIYCGCCPFEHCPNIRPAFALLNEMKFTNAHLLNLAKNLKADWIDKGYPMQD